MTPSYVVKPSLAPVMETEDGRRHTILVGGAGEGLAMVLEAFRPDSGKHRERWPMERVGRITKGKGLFSFAGEEWALEASDYLHVPGETAVDVSCVGEEELEILWVAATLPQHLKE